MMRKWWIFAAALLAFAGCQPREDNVVSPSKNNNLEQTGNSVPAVDAGANANKQRARIEAFVEKNADAFISFAMRSEAPADLSNMIQKLVDQPKANKGLKSSDYGDLALPPLTHVTQLKEIYEAQNYAPIFVRGNALPKYIETAIDTFRKVDERGFTPKMLDPTAFLAAVDELKSAGSVDDDTFVLTADERRIIADEIEKSGVDIANSQAVKPIITKMLAEDSPLPRLRDAVKAKAKGGEAVKWAALADVLFADHVMNYAQTVKFNNRTHLTEEEEAQVARKPSEKTYQEIAQNRLRPWFDDITKTSSVEEFDTLWNGLYPVHPQYELLVDAHRRYRDLPDWNTVPEARLTLKKSSPSVGKMKLRLAAEGLYKGDVSEQAQADSKFNVYDEEIRAAVRAYHDTHQLEYDESKGLQKSFWSSLNTPRKDRLTVIDENIRRMYNTFLVDSDLYIYINVPDFYGEVWQDHNRIYRFPVVAGSARRSCNPKTQQYYYINATPLMHSKMQYLEYNPYWNVPGRIEQEDYIQKINADPTWLETHGFEYYTDGGHTILRQLPGENNALGRVKFIFPNPHATFLHDSPKKHFFKYPIRAFSHGCMRVWEPLKLAELLLKLDGQWRDKIKKEIEDFQPKRIVFKNRMDVFIDYFTVRVDENGLTYFLSDPYHYVKDSLNPPSAKSLACKPSNKGLIKRASQAGGDGVGSDDTTGVD